MRRRDFIIGSLAGLLVLGLGRRNASAVDPLSRTDQEAMQGLRPWDAHAHPHSFFTDRPDATTPTLAMMKELGLAVCVFSAVGDRIHASRAGARGGSPKFDTAGQLDRIKGWAKDGHIALIKKKADLDNLQTGQLGAIVGIEGGDALEGKLENLDYFYEEFAVRMITLMHDRTNEIGGQNIRDLPKVVRAMAAEGLSRTEIRAYLGGNLERVVRACLG